MRPKNLSLKGMKKWESNMNEGDIGINLIRKMLIMLKSMNLRKSKISIIIIHDHIKFIYRNGWK